MRLRLDPMQIRVGNHFEFNLPIHLRATFVTSFVQKAHRLRELRSSVKFSHGICAYMSPMVLSTYAFDRCSSSLVAVHKAGAEELRRLFRTVSSGTTTAVACNSVKPYPKNCTVIGCTDGRWSIMVLVRFRALISALVFAVYLMQ